MTVYDNTKLNQGPCIVCKTPIETHNAVSTKDGLVHPNLCYEKYMETKKINKKKLNEGDKQTTLLEDLQPITMLMD